MAYALTGIFIPAFILLIPGVLCFGRMFTTVQSMSIQNNSIVINYLLNQKTVLADEVRSVSLKYQYFETTESGGFYLVFIALTLINEKVIQVPGLNTSLPVVYLVLKNWHKKNTVTLEPHLWVL